jgi:hypothetical protein
MGVVAKSSGTSFKPAPAGTHAAVCVDVIDHGMVETEYNGKKRKQHKIRIVWQIEEKMEDGRPFIVGRRYTVSLNERASLRKDLETWRGRPFTEDELNGFDLDNVLHVPAMLSVIQEARNGEVYANVSAVMKMPRNMLGPKPDPSYVRVQDRPKDGNGESEGPPPSTEGQEWPTDDDVPF